MCLKCIELHPTEFTRRKVTSFSEVRQNILESIRDYLELRFEADDRFLEMIDAFINFKTNANIETIHAAIAPDLALGSLSLQFDDISSYSEEFSELSLHDTILRFTKTNESRQRAY